MPSTRAMNPCPKPLPGPGPVGHVQRRGFGIPGWVLLIAAVGGLVAQEPPSPRSLPPLPPLGRPPVEVFRELLNAGPERRQELLRTKPAPARELIERRLREHAALPPEARVREEAQLRLAQFRYYLLALVRVPAGDRPGRLDLVPAEDRPLLEERLRAWDNLPEEARRALLESSESLHHFIQHPGADPARLAQALAAASPASRPDIEQQFARWSALPESERAARTAAFQSFFGLSDGERNRALDRLPDSERVVMERTLERFARLPEHERQRCIDGFGKLSGLPVPEREAFLRNAERWQALSPEERAQWRRLVLQPSPPPLPPVSRPGIVATNR